MESSEKIVALGTPSDEKLKRQMQYTSIEAHSEVGQKRGHTNGAVVEEGDGETAAPIAKHTEEMRPKITEEMIW